MSQFDSCTRVKGRMNNFIGCSNTNIELPEIEMFGPMARAPPPADVLNVIDVKMYEQMNKVAHRTNRYDNSRLIVRRGQEFIIGIVFNRPFNPQIDTIAVEFLIGGNPTISDGTYITVTFGQTNELNKWKGRLVDTKGTETRVGITPASYSIIGLFSTYVLVVTPNLKKRTKRNPKTDVYVLFNPWVPLDQVYLATEDQRTEYVLNDFGIIYNGTEDQITDRPWNYGQFKSGVLDACLFILDFGKMPLQFRGEAAKLTRKASAMMNAQDDNGVLVGNWSEDFSLGTAPTAWTGSAEILLKYAADGGVPLKFAQCWVYAGVMNTFFRCLGIPSRVITNFSSAHDNMGNLTTYIVLNENGQIDSEKTTDSIWNFHCWNEVFMKRSDIPPIYSGWQVVDCTPQNMSDGYFRCGPTAVKAIKEGQLSFQFDGAFVFAEVNSDVVICKEDRYGNRTVLITDTTYVGKLILTKKIGSTNSEDITQTYKYPEGSAEDKRTMQRAEALGMTRYHATQPVADVQLQSQAVPLNQNQDVNLIIYVNNLSNEQRTISVSVTGKVDYYTGVTKDVFKVLNNEVTLGPRQAKQETITISAAEYQSFTTGQPFLSFIVYGYINETTLSLIDQTVVRLNVPPLFIEVSGDTQVGGDIFVTVEFTNTLGYDLNNVTLKMEGSGLMPVKTKLYSKIIKGSSVKWTEMFTPQLPGPKTLVACLDCTAIREVCGQVSINILPE